MLSICTTIYQDPTALEVFIRTLFGNASEPDLIELIIMNDGEDPETEKVLLELSKEFHQLKHFGVSKRKRIEFFKQKIRYYKERRIFDSEIIYDMHKQVKRYEKNKIKSLWFPAGRGYNASARRSKGDFLLFMPADFICFFDITAIYKEAKKSFGEENVFVGYFDWVDFTSIAPELEAVNAIPTLKGHSEFREFSKKWIEESLKQGLNIVEGQHGSRIINRELFEEIGGFDTRWFLRALTDDLFNEKAKKYQFSAFRLNDKAEMKWTLPYMGSLRPFSVVPSEYLTPKYRTSPDSHLFFLNKIKDYI